MDLPKLTTFTTGDWSFVETTSLTLSSIFSFFLSYQQMFLSRMVNIHMEVDGHLMIYEHHPFNLIQVSFLSFISFIVSTNLKQQISSYLKK